MASAQTRGKAVWLDCDPGHDDAIALLFALFAPSTKNGASHSADPSPAINLLGVSVVAGNAPVSATYANAARLLTFYGAPLPSHSRDIESGGVHLLCGSEVPLNKQPRSDPGIHGEDGLGGVTGLPALSSEEVQRRVWASYDGPPPTKGQGAVAPLLPTPSPGSLLVFWHHLLTHRIQAGLPKLTIVATGPLTNVALLMRGFPDLVEQGVQEIVIMGGAPPGERGNRGPLAEFNILVDPEAADIVFNFNVPVIMAGLNVTHQAIFRRSHLERLLNPPPGEAEQADHALNKTLASIMTFFSSTYATEFGFLDGPPVHDVLAVAYVVDPTLFYCKKTGEPPKRYQVQIETYEHSLAMGATVIDFYEKKWERGEEEWWGRGGRNAVVLEEVDTERLWDLFFACVQRCAQRRRALGGNASA